MARTSVFARDVKLIVDRNLSVEARQKMIARQARKILAEAKATNAHAFEGREPSYRQAVDGKVGAALESVNPDRGKIVFTFNLTVPVIEKAHQWLVAASPVLTGRYAASHILLVDGVEVDWSNIPPDAEEYTILSPLPYARKIERGQSNKAPDGVYEVTEALINARFGNIVRARFTYRSVDVPAARTPGERKAQNDTRQPAIVIKAR